MRALLTALICVALALPALAQPPELAPPVGEERAKMLEGIRASYPSIPDRIAGIMADARRQVGPDSDCELMRFLADPASKAPEGAARTAAMFLPMRCGSAPEGLTAEAAAARLGDRTFAIEVGADAVVALARSKENGLRLCCSVQTGMVRLGDSDLWAARIPLADLDRGILTLGLMTRTGLTQEVVYRGPKAPPKPAEKPRDSLKGQVLERQMQSAALGETRKLSIYLPPGWTAGREYPALFLADGMARGYAPMVEAMIDAGDIRPIVLVSALTGPEAIVGTAPSGYDDLRSAEYIRDFMGHGDRFDRHMRFFGEELPAYAAREFGASRRREDRAVAGYSNGGVLALWAGLMHPEAFGVSVAMSPGIAEVKAADLKLAPRARFFMSGGLYESPFQLTARGAEKALKDAGYQVSGKYLAAGHMSDQWEIVLHDALLEIFSTGSASASRIAATN